MTSDILVTGGAGYIGAASPRRSASVAPLGGDDNLHLGFGKAVSLGRYSRGGRLRDGRAEPGYGGDRGDRNQRQEDDSQKAFPILTLTLFGGSPDRTTINDAKGQPTWNPPLSYAQTRDLRPLRLWHLATTRKRPSRPSSPVRRRRVATQATTPVRFYL